MVNGADGTWKTREWKGMSPGPSHQRDERRQVILAGIGWGAGLGVILAMTVADSVGAWRQTAPGLGACAGSLLGFLVGLTLPNRYLSLPQSSSRSPNPRD